MIETGIRSADVAFQISARAFLNSLMREWTGWSLVTGSGTGADAAGSDGAGPRRVRFPLPSRGSCVEIEIVHLSRVGQHVFRLPFREHRGAAPPRIMDFPDFAGAIANEPVIVGTADPTAAPLFLRRVFQSVANIGDVIARAPARSAFLHGDPTFLEAEQALRFGHSVHPTPRSRDEFTAEDSRRFAAEYGNGFPLRWWSAAPEAVVEGASRGSDPADLFAGLVADDPALDPHPGVPAEGRVLLPMHPWQAARLALDPEIDGLFRSGHLVDHGAAGAPWFATTSLRSLHTPHARWMLKHSLSLRLTNSLRLIKGIECERGLVVDAVLAGPVGAQVAARFPTLHVLREPAYRALRVPGGALLPQTIVALRENPFRGPGQPRAAVLAALCEIYPDGRGSALADTILRVAEREDSAEAVARAWFGRFLRTAVGPILQIQCDHGLLFGAHQQNLVIGLDGGWPSQAFFRDCQGTGFVREFLPALREAAPGLDLEAGHLFRADEAARIMGYYLIVNSVFAVIGALGIAGLAREDDLVAMLRAFIEDLAAGHPSDDTCLRFLLTSRWLGSKGNFMICFRNINENTDVTDPLAGYAAMPNPIAACSAEVAE